MPECIVCKGYYTSSTVCPRCGSDNGPWEKWRQAEPVEQGGLRGLLHFTEPHFHLPFLLTAMAMGFGLMGIAAMWAGVNLAVRLLAVFMTVGGCLAIIQGVYTGRHKLREDYLLTHVKTARSEKGPQIRFGTPLKMILTWVIVVGIILLLGWAFIRSDELWKIVAWLLLEPTDTTPVPALPDDIRVRVAGALPLFLLLAYVGIHLALVYSSAKMLAHQYAAQASKVLPPPIFLQGELLTRVVQQEAQRYLSRAQPPSTTRRPLGKNSTAPGTERGLEQESGQKNGGWAWEDVERTGDGGIRLTAWRKGEHPRVEESITGHRTEYSQIVSYTVEADPWGRITRITRSTNVPPY
jgi:hypothetical protein